MKKLSIGIVLLILTIVSCKEKDNNEDQNLGLLALVALSGGISEIPFQLSVGTDTSFGCNKLVTSQQVSTSTNFYLKDARFYVHDVKLVKADGSTVDFTLTSDNKWQTSKVALLDFEDGTGDCSSGTTETNKSLKGSAPLGSYVGVEFKVGVPVELNHMLNTTADAPLNSSAMYWSWVSGYKFMKFEWVTRDGAATNGTFHLGSGTCSGTGSSSTCSIINVPTITVKTSGSVAWNPTSNPVYFDAKALVNTTNTNPSSGGAALTCMAGNANAACKPLLNNVGVKETDGTSLGSQSTFYIKP
ncbi:MbnP family copper-binding protein [Leptospira idonii]|uniref:Metallo-mystery pair system four-Cys motif protein n=1 Tax=Leptospira idonii TaxID=1193500 RepID=A0A4R9M176_9LEPT|nr:MbnP family copper-binding protein [Leptospira idonii]TGN19802.1 metallo-mystery pair system four-Cys motif protein [Leptospira idonii]